MESLYSKLYDKYTKLKNKKEAENEKLNRDQEEKFMAYMSAADELVEHLKSENEKLRGQVNDLRSEAASIRFAKDQECAERQKLLMEEKHKNKEALKEIERLKVAEQEDKTRSGSKKRKMLRDSPVTNRETEQNCHLSNNGKLSQENLCQPNCCRVKIRSSTGEESGDTMCAFQGLAECIIGMKLSIDTETNEDLCMSFVHQSSGFSFNLRWRREGSWWLGEGEEEVVYKVVTLGSFEKVAPHWIRQIMIFSNTMFPLFLQRLSRVINLSFRQS